MLIVGQKNSIEKSDAVKCQVPNGPNDGRSSGTAEQSLLSLYFTKCRLNNDLSQMVSYAV